MYFLHLPGTSAPTVSCDAWCLWNLCLDHTLHVTQETATAWKRIERRFQGSVGGALWCRMANFWWFSESSPALSPAYVWLPLVVTPVARFHQNFPVEQVSMEHGFWICRDCFSWGFRCLLNDISTKFLVPMEGFHGKTKTTGCIRLWRCRWAVA